MYLTYLTAIEQCVTLVKLDPVPILCTIVGVLSLSLFVMNLKTPSVQGMYNYLVPALILLHFRKTLVEHTYSFSIFCFLNIT